MSSRQSYLSSSPATRQYVITPADADLDNPVRALYIADDGDLVIEDHGGNVVTYPVVAGQIIPFSPKQIRAATTASVIGWQ